MWECEGICGKYGEICEKYERIGNMEEYVEDNMKKYVDIFRAFPEALGFRKILNSSSVYRLWDLEKFRAFM